MNPELILNGRILDILDRFDPTTALHCKRVSILCEAIGAGFGLPKEDLTLLSLAGLLHDLGMIAIPKSILLKSNALSAGEYAVLKMHVDTGAVIAETAEYGQAVVGVIQQHHERLDGSGYPHGLVGEQIDWFSRIVAVADVYTAMTSDRPYRRALTEQMAINELNQDNKFDIEVVNVLELILASPSGKRFRAVSGI